MEDNKDLAIVILVGGKSNRLGTEKPIIDILGKPLILHQIDVLLSSRKKIFLVAHSEEQVYSYRKTIKFPKEICFIIDDRELFSFENIYKPMLGIYSAFKELNENDYQKAFLLSCDMPLIKPEVVTIMIKESKDYECCIPKWNNGFLEYFFAVYPIKKGFEKAKTILLNQNFGLVNFLDEKWKTNYVSVEKNIKPLDKNLVSFVNINGPIDILKVINLFKSQNS